MNPSTELFLLIFIPMLIAGYLQDHGQSTWWAALILIPIFLVGWWSDLKRSVKK